MFIHSNLKVIWSACTYLNCKLFSQNGLKLTSLEFKKKDILPGKDSSRQNFLKLFDFLPPSKIQIKNVSNYATHANSKLILQLHVKSTSLSYYHFSFQMLNIFERFRKLTIN